jgi:methionyl aminopeptidase
MGVFQIFTDDDIASVRKAGAILSGCLAHVASLVKPGVTTEELDRAAEAFIRDRGGLPAFKGYRGYPATLCLSVNEECVHGIPGKRVLKDGDIISIDGGVTVDGLYTDACRTVAVGKIPKQTQALLSVTEEALREAVQFIRAGVRIGDISALIQRIVQREGFSPVRSLTGHGLGRSLHQFPDIPNSGEAGTGPKLPERTLIAVEPIVSMGSPSVVTADDGWTISISDGSLSAHFEHTLLVWSDRCEIIA